MELAPGRTTPKRGQSPTARPLSVTIWSSTSDLSALAAGDAADLRQSTRSDMRRPAEQGAGRRGEGLSRPSAALAYFETAPGPSRSAPSPSAKARRSIRKPPGFSSMSPWTASRIEIGLVRGDAAVVAGDQHRPFRPGARKSTSCTFSFTGISSPSWRTASMPASNSCSSAVGAWVSKRGLEIWAGRPIGSTFLA